MKTPLKNQESVSQAVFHMIKESGTVKAGNFEAKRTALVKDFKILTADERQQLCGVIIEAIKERFAASAGIDDLLYLFASCIASEKDWETTLVFLDNLLTNIDDIDSLKDIAIALLDIADNELSEEHRKLPTGQTALVLLTEMGLKLANRSGKSSLDPRGVEGVVEYITTNLLARSNINDNAMRIALIHYLSQCPLNNHATVQLNRVISRFGQSLLDELLKAYFEDKKRGNAAFHFLLQHLNFFFISSPALGEMSHTVLKHYMLKFPDEFPAFISAYCDRLPREEIRLEVATRHVALLLRAAIDVSKRNLAEEIADILIKHLSLFRDVSEELTVSQVLIARQIIVPQNARPSSASMVVEEFLVATQPLLGEKYQNEKGKVISFGRSKKLRKSHAVVRSSRIGLEPTPLETMLALAN